MSYLADLAPFTYESEPIPDGVRALAVGWLDAEHEFRVQPPDAEFLELLFALCREHRTAQTRGFHQCEMCDEGGLQGLEVSRGADSVRLGSAEIRLVGKDGIWLVAPDLVYHYVAAHDYAPPPEFVEAVRRGSVAPGT